MKLHRVLNGLLILLLLCAQQAAYAHAISHWVKASPAKEQLAHSKLCDKCVSFEKVGGIAPTNAVILAGLELHFALQPQPAHLFRARTLVAFQSRAPPHLL